VGPHGGTLFGQRIRTSLDEISDPIDLAVILTPAKTVPDILEQCGRKGIHRAVIESGGFGELDEEGNELGARLVAIAEKYGIRFIGPNCIGIMNAYNGLATPFTTMQNVFRRGGVGIIAQSGGVALSFLNMFDGEQLGYSKFAAIGNKLSIDENDVLEYFVEDPETSVVCMYLESINDGRRMCEIARRSQKPIVVHKSNIGSLSRVAAQSHTQALANDDQVVDAALRQVGMVRYRDMQNYLDFVKVMQLPPMKGRNLAIVSRSGGHAVIAADAASIFNFNLPPFREDFLAEIRKHLRADVIHLSNPLDLGDLFDFDVYVRIIEHTIQQDNVDGILFLHSYFSAIEGEGSRRLLKSAAELSHKYSKPVAMSVATEQVELSLLHKLFDFPIFMSPERAVLALDTSIKYHRHKEFMKADHEVFSVQPLSDDATISAILARVSEQNRSPVLHEALEIVESVGLKTPEYRVFQDAAKIGDEIDGLPGPYAVKVIAEGVSHKSDLGGVVLGLPDKAAVHCAATDMAAKFAGSKDAGFQGVLVQRMAQRTADSFELIVGGKRDPQFGPVVLLGHGGIFVEVFGKTSLRMAPLSGREIEQMIEDLPGSEIFKGVRGRPAMDLAALKDAIARVAHLMVEFPEIDSIDINPLLVSESGALCLDARIVLQS
jgi:acetyltransferase